MNDWCKISRDYYMCFLYDVWLAHGVWYASFYVGPRFEGSYKTAQDAMTACDQRGY